MSSPEITNNDKRMILSNRGRTPGSRGVQVGCPRQRMRSGRYGMTGWPGMQSRSPR